MNLAELLNFPSSENNKLAMIIIVFAFTIIIMILPCSFILHSEEAHVES